MQTAVKATLAGALLIALLALPALLPASKQHPAEAGIIVTLDPDSIPQEVKPLLDIEALEEEPGVAQKGGEGAKKGEVQQASPMVPQPPTQAVLRDEPVQVETAPPAIPEPEKSAEASKTKPEPAVNSDTSRQQVRAPRTVTPAVSAPTKGPIRGRMIGSATSPATAISEAPQPVQIYPWISVPTSVPTEVIISHTQPDYTSVPIAAPEREYDATPAFETGSIVGNSQPKTDTIVYNSDTPLYPIYPVVTEEKALIATQSVSQEATLSDAPPLDIAHAEVEVPAPSAPNPVITSVSRADPPPAEQRAPVPTASGWKTGLNIGLEVTAYHERFEYDEKAYNNPGNWVYGFPDSRNVVEIEPKVRYMVGNFELEVSPRLTWEQVRIITGDNRLFKDTVTDFEVPYARASYSTGPFWVQAGRYEKVWGPSIFVSPSNPFEGDRDFVEASYAIPGSNWTASLVYNFDDGLEDDGTAPILLTKASWKTQTASFSALTQGGEHWYGIGGYGQWSPIPEALLYADGLLSYGPRDVPDPTYFGLHDFDEKEWEARILVGAAYRFGTKTTLAAEYMHNTHGYSDYEADQVFDLQRRAFSSAAPWHSRNDIERLMDIEFLDFGRHYLMGSLRQDDVFDNIDIGVRYAHNLDDSSGRLTGNIDWYLSDTAKLFAEGELFHGDTETEFGRFADYELTLGVSWRPKLGLF